MGILSRLNKKTLGPLRTKTLPPLYPKNEDVSVGSSCSDSISPRPGYDEDYTAERIKMRRDAFTGGKALIGDQVLGFLHKCHKEDMERTKTVVGKYVSMRSSLYKSLGREPEQFISRETVKNETSQDKAKVIHLRTRTSDSLVILLFQVRKHIKGGKISFQEKMLHALRDIEELATTKETYGARVIILFDVGKLGLKNMDTAFVKNLAVIQKTYRDLIETVYITNAGGLFLGSWKIVRPFFSPRILEKIKFLKGKDALAHIGTTVASEDLSRFYEAASEVDMTSVTSL